MGKKKIKRISLWYASNHEFINSSLNDGVCFMGIETKHGTKFIPTEKKHMNERMEDFEFARRIIGDGGWESIR